MSLRSIAEAALPGWTMVEHGVQDNAADAPASDFVAHDIGYVQRKLSGLAKAAEPAAEAFPAADGSEGESGIVSMYLEQSDPGLSRRAVVVVNGKAIGVQG